MTRRRRGLPLPAALLLFLFQASVCAGIASAEYGGRSFYIERPQLGLDLSYDYRTEDQEGPYVSTKNTTQALIERLDLQTEGWAYHPAFLTYLLELSPEWEQVLEEPEPGADTTRRNFLLGYSLDTTFFPYKPVTLRLLGRRQKTVLDSSLAGRSETTSDAYGGSLTMKNRTLPTTLAYLHTTLDQTGYYDSTEVRDRASLQMRHDEKSNQTDLKALYEAVDRTALRTTTGTENFFGGAFNTWRLAPDQRGMLNSVLSYRWFTSDEYRSTGVTLGESLTWKHTPNFSTNYTIQYNGDSSQVTSVDTVSGSAGFTHLLYENLTTTGSVRGNYSSQGENITGGNLSFSYQRPIPRGTIYASMGQDYSVTTRSAPQTFVSALDEPHVLRSADVTFLDHQNVVLPSIVVTSADRGIVYRLDVDYRIEVVGTSVRISRDPFGAIAEGQTVLVNYTYLGDPNYNSDTYTQSYGAGLYLWSAWRIHYRYFDSKESFLSGTPPDVLNETTMQTLDTDLAWRWTTTRFLWEDTDTTTGVSLSRWRASENLSFRPANEVSLGASGYYGETTFKETNSTETVYGYGAKMDWNWARWSKIGIESSFAKTDGASNRTEDREALARLEWYYGIWSGEFTYRFLNEQDLISGQTVNRHSAYALVRRTLY